MDTNYRHGLRFFQALAARGRNDLAAMNAATDGRLRLAMFYNKKDGLSPREAWRVAWREYRVSRAW